MYYYASEPTSDYRLTWTYYVVPESGCAVFVENPAWVKNSLSLWSSSVLFKNKATIIFNPKLSVWRIYISKADLSWFKPKVCSLGWWIKIYYALNTWEPNVADPKFPFNIILYESAVIDEPSDPS